MRETGTGLFGANSNKNFRGFLNANHTDPRLNAYQPATFPSVTISCETGAGALSVGKMLLEIVQATEPDHKTWTLFETNLVQRVIEDYQLPETSKRLMPEDVKLDLAVAIEEMLGLHPGIWKLTEYTTKTIIRLASAGHTIVIGRGACMATARMPNVIHVRLVAPLEHRVKHIQEYYKMSRKEAQAYVRNTDKGRKRYVQKYFNASIDDPLLYDMVLNTSQITFQDAAQLIANAVQKMRENTVAQETAV